VRQSVALFLRVLRDTKRLKPINIPSFFWRFRPFDTRKSRKTRKLYLHKEKIDREWPPCELWIYQR
jgi:hypothetical protein